MKRLLLIAALLLTVSVGVSAQGALSNQVLQLLTRVNTWVGTQTFQDLRFPVSPCSAIPSTTAGRIYTDTSCNLYFNGALIAGAGGVTNPHNLLSTTHADTLAASVVRGDVIIGNSTPAWSRLAIGGNGTVLRSNGTDVSWGTDASSLTNIPAANLTGTIAAISGVNLTNLNASNLASGTVATGRLTGVITNTEVNAAAAIAYSKLALSNSILNADINSSAAIAYSKLNLTGSVVNGDLTNATILFAKWASNSCTNLQVPQFNGAAWVCKSLVTSDVSGAGTTSSVALALPSFITVSGSPVTTTGTLTGTLATQSANLIFAGPTTGAAAAPTFRSMVVADLPTITSAQVNNTIALTGTDINTSNQVTATHLAAALPFAQGGTNLTVAANNTTLISNGAAWAAKSVPDCVATGDALQYTAATSTFSCGTSSATHNLLSATHTDTLAASPTRGDLIVANSTPAWARFAKGVAGTLLTMGANDPSWSATVAAGTLTSSTPWTWTQTWNAGGVSFVGASYVFTETASAAGSTYLRILGGSSGTTPEFAINEGGKMTLAGLAVSPPVVATNTAAYTAIFNTNSESYFGIGSDLKIPAGAMNAAQHQIVIDLRGVYGVNGAGDTFLIKVKFCTVSGCGSGTVVTAAVSHNAQPGGAETNRGWTTDVKCNVFTAGVGGTLDCQGFLTYGISTVNANGDDMLNTSAVTVDTTVDEYVSATVTFNNTNVANTITLRSAAIRVY